jgi:membrane protein implicated in regulation of membrane protease activity
MMPSYGEPERVVGRPAHVSVAIPGGAKAGEVVVRIRGGSEAYIAYSDQQIDAGAEVVVVADLGARSVSVAPL